MKAIPLILRRPAGMGEKPGNPHGYRVSAGLLVAILGIFATGCATKPAAETVKVPVYAPCILAMPIKPTFEVQTLGPGASDGEKVLALARDTPLHFKYEGQLEAALAGCL